MLMSLRIDSRFRGPPTSGNGGYVAGALAERLGGSDCEVTLRSPPPLDCDLDIKADGEELSLWAGDQLIAVAKPASVELNPPPPPDIESAKAASGRFTGFESHIFPACFVCGPDRAQGDGLRVFAGTWHEHVVAAPWEPSADLHDQHGEIWPRFVWAALDCPGYFAVQHRAGPAVLGRIAVHIERMPKRGEALTVSGWPIASEGRKHQAGTALYSGRELVATAHATWIGI